MHGSNNENYNLLEEVLEKYGKSFKDLYDNHIVSRQLITEFKSGRTRALSPSKAQQIASFIGCSLSEIYGDESARNYFLENYPPLDDENDIKKDPSDMDAEEVDEELYDLMTELRDNYALRQLLHAAKGTDAENIKAVAEMLERFKNN